MSLENKFERILLMPSLEIADLRKIYDEFLIEGKKRNGTIDYQTYGLYAELPGDNKKELSYKSAIVFFRGYGSSFGTTINSEITRRNQHLESFTCFLNQRGIPYTERIDDFRTC